MFHSFIKHLSLISLFSSTLLLSGCISSTPLNFISEIQLPEEQAEIQETTDPDLQLVKTEPEDTLYQELEALKETGQWGDEHQEIQPVAETTRKAVVYDFPVVMNKQVEVYLDLFQNRQRKTFQRWLNRSGKYSTLMETELTRAGLPRDLVYLSMIESGYNQRALSRAYAVGLWQFMKATGRQYHLEIDSYIDERCDAEKSTAAAVAFLSDLYEEFGDWHLAVAAYNAGPGKIGKGLRKYKVDNFWDLAKHRYLKLETKRYVPKLIAAIIIARDPEKYGFSLSNIAEPLAYDSLEVGPGMDMEAIAVIAGTTAKTVKRLNQELRKGITPANKASYAVKIPAGSKQLASRNMKRLHSYVSTGYKTHTIRTGETLASICRKYDINTTTLLKVNNLRSNKLVKGKNLRIPYSTVKYQLLPEGSSQEIAAYKENLVLYRIKNGDSISKIAKQYRVPQSMIVSWNGLSSIHKIRAGQQLALYIENGRQATDGRKRLTASLYKRLVSTDHTSPRIIAQSTPQPILSEQKKLPAENLGDQEQKYSWYKVRHGDSLWTISRRFQTSAAEIRKLNNLKSNLIKPGNTLKISKG